MRRTLHAFGLLPIVLPILALAGAFSGEAVAQNNLERLSVAERSDGQGYVVRFHMQSPADSFKVIQPHEEKVQLALYKNRIDPNLVELPEPDTPFTGFHFASIPNGVGVDMRLEDDTYMIADAYEDTNGTDVLVSLTEAPQQDLALLTDGIEAISWQDIITTAITDTLGEDGLAESGMAGAVTGDTLPQDASPEDGLPGAAARAPGGDLDYDVMSLDVVVLDAGHGGHDPGTIGYNGTREKNVALDVTLKVGEYIEEYMPDVEVVYTRDSDEFVALEERGSIANRNRGDLFVSIHANSMPNNHTTRGTEVYFLGLASSDQALEVMRRENQVIRFEDEDERSEELTQEQMLIYELSNSGYMATSEILAGKLDEQFADRAQRPSRGVKQARFIVLYHASMPAILVELGFLSNPDEEAFLTSEHGQTLMASAIFRSIRNYRDRVQESRPTAAN